LLALLAEKTPGSRLILLGAADESERSERLGQNWPGGYLVLCGKIAPRISAAVLEQCRLFIGHDSGPMHLAAAVGTPTLGLFAWFNPPGQWYPGHKSWNFIRTLYPPLPDGRWNPALQMRQGESDGIRLLRPEAVLKSAMELWDLDSNSAVPASSPLPARSTA
jgi:ADP-heptose:LPS heptosyltransferase